MLQIIEIQDILLPLGRRKSLSELPGQRRDGLHHRGNGLQIGQQHGLLILEEFVPQLFQGLLYAGIMKFAQPGLILFLHGLRLAPEGLEIHAFPKAFIKQGKILQLVLQPRIGHLRRCLRKALGIYSIALELIHRLGQGSAEAALRRCPLKKFQFLFPLMRKKSCSSQA